MISTELTAEIRRLFYAEHWKVGTIAAQLGVHHETVRRALKTDRFASRGTTRPSSLDPFIGFIKATLERYPKLTGTRVHEMLRGRGYRGSATQVRRRIRQLDLRPLPNKEAFFRLQVVAGEQAQVDWGHFGTMRVAGVDRPLYGLVIALSWSRAFYVDWGFEQNAAAVLRGHVAAFEDFGGVPRKLLYDNMKTVVVDRVGDAIRLNSRLVELAAHYHFAPRVCHPRRPNEKPRVERRIRDLRESFFAGRTFVDLDDLRARFRRWRAQIAYERRCPADKSLTVAEALNQERGVLLSLPSGSMDTDLIRATVAHKQPYVVHDTNRYSIPHELVGQPLTLAVGRDRVRVLKGGDVVASHARSWARHGVVEEPTHLEGLTALKKKGRHARGRTRLVDAVPAAGALYAALVQRGEPLSPNTRRLVQLLDRYGAETLQRAIGEALERETPRATSVAHIIDQWQRASGQPPELPLRLPDRADVRDLRTINHNLEDYDALANHTDA